MKDATNLTGETRVVRSFLEMLKVECMTKQDNRRQAIRFTNMRPGYGQSVTIELDTLPMEMLTVMKALLARPKPAVAEEDEVRYSEVEERILKAFAAFITLGLGEEDGRLCLVVTFTHPEHQQTISIPIDYPGDYSRRVSHALEDLAIRHLQPSQPWTESGF